MVFYGSLKHTLINYQEVDVALHKLGYVHTIYDSSIFSERDNMHMLMVLGAIVMVYGEPLSTKILFCKCLAVLRCT